MPRAAVHKLLAPKMSLNRQFREISYHASIAML